MTSVPLRLLCFRNLGLCPQKRGRTAPLPALPSSLTRTVYRPAAAPPPVPAFSGLLSDHTSSPPTPVTSQPADCLDSSPGQAGSVTTVPTCQCPVPYSSSENVQGAHLSQTDSVPRAATLPWVCRTCPLFNGLVLCPVSTVPGCPECGTFSTF